MARSVNIKPNEFDSNEVELALPNMRSHLNKKATDKETMHDLMLHLQKERQSSESH
jgi:hypothetical protein